MKARRNIEIEFEHDRSAGAAGETPYIQTIDLLAENVTLSNPQSVEISLKDYFITDYKKLHYFKFPDDCVISSNGSLVVHTCPGRAKGNAEFVQPCVLWTNHDGSLRKKEVLNNDHCTMTLHDPSGKCIATCTAVHDGVNVTIHRRREDSLLLPALQLSPSARLFAGYLRTLTVVGMVYFSLLHFSPGNVIHLYWVSFVLDLAARGDTSECDPKDPETDQRLESVNGLNDRLHTLILYVAVIKQYYIHYVVNKDVPSNLLTDHSWLNLPETFLYTALLLDFCGAMLSSHNAHKNAVHQDLYSQIHAASSVLLTLVTVGSDYFLLFLFTQLSGSGTDQFSSTSFYVLVAYVSLLCFALKQIQSISQIISPPSAASLSSLPEVSD